MRPSPRSLSGPTIALAVVATFCLAISAIAQESSFRNAPASTAQMKNPYEGNAGAVAAGKKLYGQNCSQCHGNNLQGMGPAPALINPATRKAKPGELFWFITNGDLNKGMPSWAGLPKPQRWQIVTFLESRFSQGETK